MFWHTACLYLRIVRGSDSILREQRGDSERSVREEYGNDGERLMK